MNVTLVNRGACEDMTHMLNVFDVRKQMSGKQ